MITTLGEVAQNWLDSSSPTRREALETLPMSTGYSSTLVGKALDAAFGELTRSKLEAYAKSEIISSSAHKVLLHIAAGNVFTAWLPGVVIGLMMGHECWIKPSAQEPLFASLWHRSLKKVNAAFARRVEIVRWEVSRLNQVDAVIAYGTDDTLRYLRKELSRPPIFIGYGHKISVGIIFKEALASTKRAVLCRVLQRDIEPFDLQGCLSPQVLFVEGEDGNILHGVTAAHLPEVRLWQNRTSLSAALDRYKPYLSCIGWAGSSTDGDWLEQHASQWGASRVCVLGGMQCPPLNWRNGGISLAETLK